MADLKLFQYHQRKINTVTANGQVWFMAKDVCEVLEIVNVSDAVSRVADNAKCTIGVSDSIGRERPTPFLNEAGVYKLAFRSNKPEAERFTDWLATEVIPQIRRTGKFIPARVSSCRSLAAYRGTYVLSSRGIPRHQGQAGMGLAARAGPGRSTHQLTPR